MIGSISEKTGGSIREVCRVLEFPRSSYYHASTETQTLKDDKELGDRIAAIFNRHRRRYGYRRIVDELADYGIVCAPARVRRLMKERGLHAIQPKSYTPKTSDGKASAPSPNLLEGNPLPSLPDRVWAGDITYIPTVDGWLYLAVIIDLCSRRVVGWSLDDNMQAGLVVAALEQALWTRSPDAGLKFHSDRGSQYGSNAFRSVLNSAGIEQSMSARANPYDNAWTESFIGTLKLEMLQKGRFEDIGDARTEIFEYIEAYYNTQRKHSSIGYKTPSQFEALKLTLF